MPSLKDRSADGTDAAAAAPAEIDAPGAAPFDLAASLAEADGFPVLDWDAVQRWIESVPGESAKAEAWSSCERAWLGHLCLALGDAYRLRSQGSAILVSAQPANVAEATLAFVNKTAQRVMRLLDGVATTPAWGHDILIVFEEDESYYRYVSHYYPESGEFAGSSGMYINKGCGHFVTVQADLRSVEPVIAHELTHACLIHLPIPAWLNEGLAVNTESRLCPPPQAPANPRQLHARHRKFWGPEEIQEFWSGKSFLRNDEGNELSYDLARLLVSQFSADWDRFRRFALAADLADAAAWSARENLDVDLGIAVCAVLEREPDSAWAPRPEVWHGEPERGAF
ncbi:hypothetical protein [uncultured Methylibium sp.]|uniref:hypothetical protein n=1 Tax=uncultured Methylibium sp. TaxID=381093 RepID=UPI0025D0E7F2|nr:hypothetical protein [uncultured Methylibium sp.]